MKNPNANIHQTSPAEHVMGMAVSVIVNAAIFLLIALSSGSSEPQAAPQTDTNKVFCRYIEDGKLYQFDFTAADWQAAEEIVCGSKFRDVRLGASLVEGAKLLLTAPDHNAILLAQRESCSCSSEDKVPVLQDIGIVEAPRIGAVVKNKALPRIFNAPEPSVENTISTTKSNNPKPKSDKKPEKETSLQDLLNAANAYDPSRPTSEVDPGGSPDGSRLSKSATGKGDPYLQKVKARLDNTMNAPAGIPSAELKKLKATLTIVIGGGGVLTKWEFTKKSGNASFDKMIEMNLKQFMLTGSMRFPDPPDKFKYQTIPVVVDGSAIR